MASTPLRDAKPEAGKRKSCNWCWLCTTKLGKRPVSSRYVPASWLHRRPQSHGVLECCVCSAAIHGASSSTASASRLASTASVATVMTVTTTLRMTICGNGQLPPHSSATRRRSAQKSITLRLAAQTLRQGDGTTGAAIAKSRAVSRSIANASRLVYCAQSSASVPIAETAQRMGTTHDSHHFLHHPLRRRALAAREAAQLPSRHARNCPPRRHPANSAARPCLHRQQLRWVARCSVHVMQLPRASATMSWAICIAGRSLRWARMTHRQVRNARSCTPCRPLSHLC